MLSAAGLPAPAVFASEMLRTVETVAPLARAADLKVTSIPAAATKELAARVLPVDGGIVVIAGHSNTVPAIIQTLGGLAGVIVPDAEFNHLYLLASPGGASAKLAALTYGR